MTGKTDNWSWGHLGGDVETPRNLQQGALRRLLVMGNVEPEPTIFCNQARIPVVGRRYQPNRKTFHLRFILPAKCAGLAVPQNLWEWPKTDGSSSRVLPLQWPHVTLSGWPESRVRIAQRSRTEPNTTVPTPPPRIKSHWHDSYTHTLEPSARFLGEASSSH